MGGTSLKNIPLLRDLELFCVIVRRRSFRAAATDLGVSPAYVSKRIALLESALGAQLFHRTTRQVMLTDHGETVYRWCQRLFDDVEHVLNKVSNARVVPRGLLRICTSTGFGRNHVAPVVSRLVKTYPALEVQLEFLDRPVDIVGEGFDIDIRLGGIHEPHLIARRVLDNHRILCASPEYLRTHGVPQTLEDLNAHECIIIRERDHANGVWRLTGPGARIRTIKVRGRVTVNNGEVAHRMAIDGHGILLRSQWDVNKSLQEGTLVQVLPDYYQEAHAWAVYPSRLSKSAKVRVFVEMLKNAVATSAGQCMVEGGVVTPAVAE